MNPDQVEKFIQTKTTTKHPYVKIQFKKREPIYGLFLTDGDYAELKTKNFWRIVTSKNFDAFGKHRDRNLSRIFSGSDFTKLTSLTEEF